MSITISKSVSKMAYYPDYGLYVAAGSDTSEIKFTFVNLNYFDGSTASANFSVEIGGSVSAELYRFAFDISSGENPADVAEGKLQKYLEGA